MFGERSLPAASWVGFQHFPAEEYDTLNTEAPLSPAYKLRYLWETVGPHRAGWQRHAILESPSPVSSSFGLLPRLVWVSETEHGHWSSRLAGSGSQPLLGTCRHQAFSFSWQVGFTEPLCRGES